MVHSLYAIFTSNINSVGQPVQEKENIEYKLDLFLFKIISRKDTASCVGELFH